MEYQIVNLEEKTVAGVMARTSNAAPDMGAVIGGLWEKFYPGGVHDKILNRKNEKALGIYMDYAQEEQGEYTALAACEVNGEPESLPTDAVVRTIPAGKYAKFVVKGHMERAVMQFWQEVWKMDLPRAYTCDFEEYQNAEVEQAEIHIYISLKSNTP